MLALSKSILLAAANVAQTPIQSPLLMYNCRDCLIHNEMLTHPAAVAVALHIVGVLQVGRRVRAHGGEHALAATSNAGVLLPLQTTYNP
jgi:hypothetical protein